MARWSLAMLDTGSDAPIDPTNSGATFGEVVAEALKVIQTGRSDGYDRRRKVAVRAADRIAPESPRRSSSCFQRETSLI